jgi:peptidyl-prolyl cis-trans isomerase C
VKLLGIISFILIGAVAVSVSLNGCGGKAGAEGTVIAEFEWNGKHYITLEEMLQEISELPTYKQAQYQEAEDGYKEYMNLMAESRLILCLAKDRKLDEDPGVLKKVQDYYHELLVDKITEVEVDEKLKLAEEDYQLYYEENKADYVVPEKVRLTCITIQDEERAKEVFQRIKDGEAIADLAAELSANGELVGPGSNNEIPGDTDFFDNTMYARRAKPFSDAAFELEVGQMNEEILHIELDGENYYLIFRKEEVQPERQQTLDENSVRRNVERHVENQKREELMTDWLIRLHEQAEVKTFSDRIPDTPVEVEEEPESESSDDSDAPTEPETEP